jgi:large subunit ribosomal protein L3
MTQNMMTDNFVSKKVMAKKLMGRKLGMTQMFDAQGNVVTCTVIHAEPSVITQIKTKANDGYEAVQMAYDTVVVKDERTVAKRVTKPLRGHFEKSHTPACRFLYEARVDEAQKFQVGQRLGVSLFHDVKFVDVQGVSKGKGYQGMIKKYNYAGGPAAHGSGFHRHAGSTGMRSSPGRCLPGGPRPSQMGNKPVTVQNLKVVAIDEERNVVIVEGAVPGANNGVVFLSNAIKKTIAKKHK